MHKLNKLFWLFAAAVVMAGCTEGVQEEPQGCPYGYMECDGDPATTCETYVLDIGGVCPSGTDNPNEPGQPGDPSQPGEPGQPGDPSQPGQPGDCTATFSYTNQYTRVETGGENDFDVYLVGSFNMDASGSWVTTDNNYKMQYMGRGVHSKTIQVKVGDTIQYKYYINGWGDDSWKTDAGDGTSDGVAQITACGMKFGNDAGVDVVNPDQPGPSQPDVPSDGCASTFTYYNQWTNTGSGGSGDFDVYLVGSFNEWLAPDPNYKMKSDGNGKHTITVNWPVGTKHEYKYYVNGWENDSWKTDMLDGQSNGVAEVTACGMQFGAAPSTPGTPSQPEIPTGDCETTFKFYNQYTNRGSGGEGDFDVYLVGSFNDWNAPDPNYKMTSDGNGSHTIKVKLAQGTQYSYKYYINGWGDNSWHSDPANTTTDMDGNSVADVKSCGLTFGQGGSGSGGGAVVPPISGDLSLAGVPKVEGKKITFTVNAKDDAQKITVTGGVSPQVSGKTVTDTVSAEGKYVYTVKAGDAELYVPVWVESKAFDWHDALLYFAFTDRFVNGDSSNDGKSGTSHSESDWYGGDFKGMREKVESGYFDALGVNTLWISSVNMNTQKVSWGTGSDSSHSYSAYHSYWPISTFMTASNKGEFGSISLVEPHFGTMEELKALVDACHARGMRVLVDFAANHVHTDSPMYQKHKDWFNGDASSAWLCDDNGGWDKAPETCWFSKDLPDINYGNAEARRLMVEHAIWLIKETNVDGFRVDAVKHMAVQFIKDLRYAVDSLFANTGITFYMVGETFTGDVAMINKYIGNDLLHAQFDFNLYFAMRDHVLGSGSYQNVKGVLDQQKNYKSDLMGIFMGNHDVARAISVAAGHNQNKWGHNDEVSNWEPHLRVKTAWTLLMTNPGVPLIYYGDEYGLEGSNDPDNRRMMEFDNSLNAEQKGTLEYVKKLGKIRAAHKGITRGKRTDLKVESNHWCYKVSDGSETIVVGISSVDNVSCNLGSSMKLYDLLNDKDAGSQSSLSFGPESKLQVYLVK